MNEYERRVHPRAILDRRVWICKFKANNEAEDLHDCLVHDISEGGVQVFSNAQYHAGQLVMLTQQIGDEGDLTPVVGVITWAKLDSNENKYGIKFLNLSENSLREIQSIVARLLIQGEGR